MEKKAEEVSQWKPTTNEGMSLPSAPSYNAATQFLNPTTMMSMYHTLPPASYQHYTRYPTGPFPHHPIPIIKGGSGAMPSHFTAEVNNGNRTIANLPYYMHVAYKSLT